MGSKGRVHVEVAPIRFLPGSRHLLRGPSPDVGTIDQVGITQRKFHERRKRRWRPAILHEEQARQQHERRCSDGGAYQEAQRIKIA